MASKSPITCHVLDSSTGEPAQGIKVQLLAQSVAVQPTHSTLPALPPTHAGVWVGVGTSVTNSDGRCLDLLPPSRNADSPSGSPPSHALRPGRTYQIVFETEEYFKRTGRKSFYPFVQITFTIENPSEHYHVPLLISPFSYTTYRGS